VPAAARPAAFFPPRGGDVAERSGGKC